MKPVIIPGRYKPYTRMTRRGKYVSERAQAYLASQEAFGWALREAMQAAGVEAMPEKTPLGLLVAVQEDRGGLHDRDLSNVLKAVEDASQGILLKDDRWIDLVLAVRWLGPTDAVAVGAFPLDGPVRGWVRELVEGLHEMVELLRED